MKKIDWTKLSAIAEILSAVAIVVTLLYLAAQTEQNNRLLAAQTSFNILQNRVDPSFYQDNEVAELFAKLNSGVPLSDTEEFRVDSYLRFMVRKWEWEYGQALEGNIPEDDLPVASWRQSCDGRGWLKTDRIHSVWADLRASADSRFVDFMEEVVLSC